MHALDQIIREVQAARVIAATAKLKNDKILKDAKTYAEAETGYPEKKKTLAKLDKKLREAVVKAYQADPVAGKKVIGKLGVTTKDVVAYDPHKALEWAKERGVFLQLNTTVFDDYALCEHEQLDFVTLEIDGKVTASVPTNLQPVIDILNEDE